MVSDVGAVMVVESVGEKAATATEALLVARVA
jgi:hypothetical protein